MPGSQNGKLRAVGGGSPEKNPASIGDIPCHFGSIFSQVGEDSLDILPVPCEGHARHGN